jgi:transcriptional regulator with XRE-family HTH domain
MVRKRPTPLGIGSRLRELRERKRMSQGDIEESAGLLRCYISRVENGHTVPSLETLERFASALEVPISEFFKLKDDLARPAALPGSEGAETSHSQGTKGEDTRFLLRLRELLPRLSRRDQKVLLDLAKKMAEK